MNEIWFATLLWVGTHLGISSTPIRKLLVDRVGQGLYLALYAVIAVVTLGYLIWVYGTVPRFEYYWLPNPDLYWVAKLTMPIAFILLVGGFMVSNPTNVGMQLESPQQAAEMATGVTRITRHPLQWAIIIWAIGHLAANGDTVSVVFFGGFLVLSGLGSVLMDRKKAAALGEAWEGYREVTSNLPFAAIISGRNRLVAKELILPIIVGLVVYAISYYFHESYTGALVV